MIGLFFKYNIFLQISKKEKRQTLLETPVRMKLREQTFKRSSEHVRQNCIGKRGHCQEQTERLREKQVEGMLNEQLNKEVEELKNAAMNARSPAAAVTMAEN